MQVQRFLRADMGVSRPALTPTRPELRGPALHLKSEPSYSESMAEDKSVGLTKGEDGSSDFEYCAKVGGTGTKETYAIRAESP